VSPEGHTSAESIIVAAQVGRAPREPWRVASHCTFGYPNAIASPSVLADGALFPNLVWLTCPWLTERVGELESAGEIARWASRAAQEDELARRLIATDAALRELRAAESGGEDPCAGVGIAGQRDPLGVKCLHAHVALSLAGIEDPIGLSVLGKIGTACPDERCVRLADRPAQGGEG